MRLKSTLGAEALPKLKAEADAAMNGFLGNAEKLYRNFRLAVG